MDRSSQSSRIRTLLIAALLAGSVAASASTRATAAATGLSEVALPGYHVTVVARGNAAYYRPDSLEVVGQHFFVGYQNGSNPDGSNHKPSTVVEYTMQGAIVRTFRVPNHCDGLRADPATGILWATSDEDANPLLSLINPTTGTVTTYPLGATAHGGGYDDLAFTGGKIFLSGSNPTLNKAGVNTGPALYTISMSGGTPIVTPDVMGDARAKDMTTGDMVTINMIDPDSLSVDPRGDVVQDNQGGSQLIFVHHPGTARQTISSLPLATQVDDTVWATSAMGSLLIADATHNAIYRVTATFKPGTVYTEAPNDSSVPGIVGTIDLHTGFISPVIIGLGSPTGLAFVPGM